ncbi:MAG: hypothetical protein OEV28_02905 [Nitrospirota bacterium]|nr:hypothetical protein [Nitrospirota bacterium]
MAPEFAIRIHEGSGKGPVVVLVHGLAVSEKIWIEPENETLFAGLLPFRRLVADLSRPPAGEDIQTGNAFSGGFAFSPSRWDGEEKPAGFWGLLVAEGYTTVTWSQREPKGPIATAVEELVQVMKLVDERFPSRKVALLCHSRGGLVARRFLETHPEERAKIAAFIGMGVPHRGSRLASFGIVLSPLMALIRGVTEQFGKNGGLSVQAEDFVARLKKGLQSEGFLELIPESSFIKSLRGEKIPGIRYISIAGTTARYIKGYLLRPGNEVSARELFTLPDSLVEKMPAAMAPDEMVDGKGDGQVSVESTRLPWADEEYLLPVNHAEMVVDKEVQRIVFEVLREMKGEA